MGLAGPKNKQRISVDPQNRQWADDQDKMGYKMLKSMGWSSGKGLGKNEDGRAEHVKVSLKSNNLGIGADKRSIDNWMDNTFAFSSLLENLNKE
ncbi:G-patch domain-containing protein, partial [Chytriomyces sp. MP71]